MYFSVKKVEASENYFLIIEFENEKKRFDMKPYLELGIFRELKNIELFNTVHKKFDTIEWANEADLDPEFLYENSEEIINEK